MPELEKTRNISIHTKIMLRRLQNFCKLSTFSNIKLDRNTTVSVFVPTVELPKLSMHKDYILVDVYQINIQINLHIS